MAPVHPKGQVDIVPRAPLHERYGDMECCVCRWYAYSGLVGVMQSWELRYLVELLVEATASLHRDLP